MHSLKHYLSNRRGLIGTTAAIITSAVVAGAAGLGAAAIASSGARSAAQRQADAQRAALSAQERAAAEAQDRRNEAVRLKQEAAKNINFPTFLESPDAQKYKGILEDRIAGRGLIDVDAASSPIIQERLAGQKRTEAGIGATASARGLGRSSVVSSQVGEASRAAERDIASRIQSLELARQEQIGQAVTQFGDVAKLDVQSKEMKANFLRGGEFEIADTIAGNAERAKSDQFAIANTIQANGASEAAWQLKQSEIWASAVVGLGKSATQTTDDILGAIESQQQTQNQAMVNRGIGGGTTSQGIVVPNRYIPAG